MFMKNTTLAIATAAIGATMFGTLDRHAEAGVVEIAIELENLSPNLFFSFGDATTNPVFQIDLGAGSSIVGIAWDINVSATGGALLNQLGLAMMPIEDAPDGGNPGFIFTPGSGIDEGGNQQFVGFLELLDPPPSFNQTMVLPSGIFYLEAFRWGGPGAGTVSVDGTITLSAIIIPAPGALAFFGFAGLARSSRRRRD